MIKLRDGGLSRCLECNTKVLAAEVGEWDTRKRSEDDAAAVLEM